MINEKINLNVGKIDVKVNPLDYKEIFDEVENLKIVLNQVNDYLELWDFNIKRDDFLGALCYYNGGIEKLEKSEFKKLSLVKNKE